MNKKLKFGSLFLLLIIVAGCSQPAVFAPTATALHPASPVTDLPSPTTTPATLPVNRVEFVYFHPKKRCATCLSIETQTRSFLENNYKDQLASSKLTFTSYDFDDVNNAALVKKYGVISSQLFINIIIDGKDNIQHLDRVWLPQVYNDSDSYKDYMNGIVSQGLKAIGNG